ncbi:thiolase family protein [Nocardiopsis ganjiahuensis]|uniref:thiolase family protein n=1 Tax=Nocardiopsis ganjiahuensis TaxID=239984 RepID=UPI00034CDA5B|nr:acetyl-CoA C-acyltransferase [Nocardiopsis ganjiahuensis]
MIEAVIVDAVRTPVGRGKPDGALHDVNSVDLLAHSLRALVDRTGIDPAVIDDVIGGVVTQVGEQAFNITRRALLAAGYPESVPGVSVDRQCGSSQQSLHFAAQGVMSGAYDVVVAAGVESMGRVPMGANLVGSDDPLGEGFRARYPEGWVGQGISAELIAAKWDLSRTRLDEFALTSHARAAEATARGAFDTQLAPLNGLDRDEGVREGGDLETLARLRPAYFDEATGRRFPEIDWRVTAANASPLSDGSAAVLVMSRTRAEELGLTPLARFHSFAVAADDPLYMLTAIIPATEKLLARAGLAVSDIDLFEVNEAFSPVVLAWADELGADLSRVNANGGAIAIGHPLGASGARLATTLTHGLHEHGGRFGLQVMCEAGGLANAMVVERL